MGIRILHLLRDCRHGPIGIYRQSRTQIASEAILAPKLELFPDFADEPLCRIVRRAERMLDAFEVREPEPVDGMHKVRGSDPLRPSSTSGLSRHHCRTTCTVAVPVAVASDLSESHNVSTCPMTCGNWELVPRLATFAPSRRDRYGSEQTPDPPLGAASGSSGMTANTAQKN